MTHYRCSIRKLANDWGVYDRNTLLRRFSDLGDAHDYVQMLVAS